MIVSINAFTELVNTYLKVFDIKGYKYAAMDQDGVICFFFRKPYIASGEWHATIHDNDPCECDTLSLNSDNFDIDIENWKELYVKIQ